MTDNIDFLYHYTNIELWLLFYQIILLGFALWIKWMICKKKKPLI